MSTMVTAVITTYKREPEMVVRAARSVLSQSYQNIELIVVDDSPDTFEQRSWVRESVEALDSRVHYIPHEKNMGACAARNTGLSAARGTYVAFLDDDDEWMPEKIEKQLSAFDRQEIGLVYCGCFCKHDPSGSMSVSDTKYLSGYVFDKLILENFIGSTSIPLIRKQFLTEIGGFDTQMKSAQDFDVWLRLAEKWEIAYVEEPLVIYHVHDGERITTTPTCRIAGQRRIIEKNTVYLEQNTNAWWFRYIKMAPEYASNRQLIEALLLWIRTAPKCPGEVKTNLKILLRVFWNYLAALRRSRNFK